MAERQRRDRVHDQRPPSRHMRKLLRQAVFAAHCLLRGLRHPTRIARSEVAELHAVLELCRRAAARDPWPRTLLALGNSVPPGPQEAIAALNLALLHLAAIDVAWRRRLVTAGIDPEWPASGA